MGERRSGRRLAALGRSGINSRPSSDSRLIDINCPGRCDRIDFMIRRYDHAFAA